MRKEKCKFVEIGWYQRKDVSDRTGIVITINGKKDSVIDFDLSSNKGKQFQSTKSIPQQSKVTIGDYNQLTSSVQSTLAKLNKKQLIEFVKHCKSYEESNTLQQNSWDFVRGAVQFLEKEHLVFDNEKKNFSDQLNQIVRINNKEYIKEIKKELKDENCEKVDIGTDKICSSSKGLVTLGNYKASSDCTERISFLTKLCQRDVIQFVDFCMSEEEKDFHENDCREFVRNAFQFLHHKENITMRTIKMFLDKLDEFKGMEPKFIQLLKDEMRSEYCTQAGIGWYQSTNIIEHSGIVILINGKKKFIIDFETPEADRISAIFRTTRGLVTIGYYNDSNSHFRSTLATLNVVELIEFVKFCMSYEVEHNYNLTTQNCRTFVRNAFQFLNGQGKVLHDDMEGVSTKLDKVIKKDEKKKIGIGAVVGGTVGAVVAGPAGAAIGAVLGGVLF